MSCCHGIFEFELGWEWDGMGVILSVVAICLLLQVAGEEL